MSKRLLLIFLSFTVATAAAAAPLVNAGDDWRYRKGSSAPQPNWQTIVAATLDASWLTGPGGFGYGDSDDATELLDMEDGYRTVYIRKDFTITAGQFLADEELVLSIDYDDGYVAYLDGVEIARANAPGAAGTEPAFNEGPSVTREAGSAVTTNLGLASSALAIGDHTLAVLGMNESLGSSDFSLIVNLSTQAPPPPLHWTLADSPIVLASSFTVAAGQTLLIDAGVEVRCPSSGSAIICNGEITANGTDAAPIRFVPTTAGGTWGRMEFLGSGQSILNHCDFERANASGIIRGRAADVTLDHCRFIDVNVQMVDLIDSSANILDCKFDNIGSGELLHFSNMPSGGHFLLANSHFGTNTGYNDIIDFTGGNRPGPIARFVGNTFVGSVDDVFDMDGTDAHIEGNIFMNVRKDSSRSSSANPITTGNDSELVIVRNIFFNCEHNVMIKEGGSVLMQNNTSFNTTPNPVSNNTDADGDEASGLIMFGEPWRGVDYPTGAIFEGNIAADLQVTDPWPILASAITINNTFLRRDFNCIENFPQPGSGNISSDPLFIDRSQIDETNILQKLALQTGSPCIGTGPNGLDMGALVPAGASISGEPSATATDTSATLIVAGPGIWSYQWRLNGGAWSSEISLVPQTIWDGENLSADMFNAAPPIELTDLADGSYTVEVLGRNSAGDWQETPTVSKTWTVGTPVVDTDEDGMPDDYETANGLDLNDPADADLDKDGDGATNLSEFIAGTDPSDPKSVLVIESAVVAGADIVITFPAIIGKSYQLQSSPDLSSGTWAEVQSVPSANSPTQDLNDTGAAGGSRKFYRIVTPAPASP